MGEHGGWAKPSGLLPNGLLPNGLLPNGLASVTRVLDAERWSKAEERTAELITCIQPNVPSEKRREDVANYVMQLIMKCFSCKVFTFGSVPLKTYLPDGDIDLTAFSNSTDESLKDTWANAVRNMLEKEEKSENAQFRVKEVQYIQAEVKIVKCLVENIVVDISFNQLGGLCTLCFLDQIDKFINQNHIFKRSIILIKAWCYYESRILGAHHGLISTYALETLVLYIFHVFNNSFAGPLEVLYRFLEFFSNFDWDKFCVSLWGPIPISSLPDMMAEPPRKDNGKVLLNKVFLDSMSAYFAVPSGGQENLGQPFVSKHFNVVDPLRTNNNLGRSVSKGNFFRIRSAFAYGAKRLARLLECPREDIIAEVNQFFMNTWQRHGSGHRPDILALDLRPLRALKHNQVEEVNNTRNITNIRKKVENISLHFGHEHPGGTGSEFQDFKSEFLSNISENTQNMHRTSNLSAISRTQSQKYNRQVNSRVPDQLERNNSSSGAVQSDKSQKMLKLNSPLQDQVGQVRFQFVRTRSSPELTETSLDLSRGRRSRPVETVQRQSSANSDYSSTRKNFGSEVTGSQSSKSSFDDPMSARHTSSHRSPEVASDSNSASNSYHGDISFGNMIEELASVNETLEMQQEEQDMVNMMGTSNLYSFNGPVQLPMHLASPHLPLAVSHLPTSMGYTQRDLAGVLPTNLPIAGPPWGTNMQIPHGLVSSPLPHFFPAANPSPNPDEMTESGNEGSGTIERNSDDNDRGIWNEHASRGFNPNDNSHQMLYLDGKHQKSHGLNFTPSRGNTSGALSRGQNKFSREDRSFAEDDSNDLFQNQTSRGSDVNSNARGANLKFFPVSPSSSRNKPASDNMRDGSAAKASKSVREKWGKKPASSVSTSSYGKGNSSLQFDSSSIPVSSEVEDEVIDWIPLSTAGTDMPERISGSASLASAHTRSQQLSVHEPAVQLAGSDPLISIGPVLVGAPRQRGPVTFVPTGPPVPFVMVPIYNFASNTGNADGSTSQYEREEMLDQFGTSTDQNIDSMENLDQSEVVMSSASSRSSAPGSSDEHKPDILNSDFASHLQNLAYGRSCQNLHYHGPLIYQSPLLVPPVYLQGHHPWDGPGRPVATNLNFTQVMGYGSRMVPVIPLQPGPDRTSGSFQRYGDETPRYRGGTGTYLPNPKVSFRDRQSNSRNHRGTYSYDRSEHGDREGNWISSKQRASVRSHGRNHGDRVSGRTDRLATGDKQADRLWDSYRHEPVASYIVHNGALGSTNSSHGSANMFGFYPEATPSSNGVSSAVPVGPPVMMVYSYDQGTGYHTAAEPLEFGSLGPMHISSGNEAPRIYDGRHNTYREGSPESSHDEPSSPQLQR